MNEEQEIYTADSSDLQVGDVVHIGDAVVMGVDEDITATCLRINKREMLWLSNVRIHGLPITRKTPAKVKITGTLVERIERDGETLALVREVEE